MHPGFPRDPQGHLQPLSDALLLDAPIGAILPDQKMLAVLELA